MTFQCMYALPKESSVVLTRLDTHSFASIYEGFICVELPASNIAFVGSGEMIIRRNWPGLRCLWDGVVVLSTRLIHLQRPFAIVLYMSCFFHFRSNSVKLIHTFIHCVYEWELHLCPTPVYKGGTWVDRRGCKHVDRYQDYGIVGIIFHPERRSQILVKITLYSCCFNGAWKVWCVTIEE